MGDINFQDEDFQPSDRLKFHRLWDNICSTSSEDNLFSENEAGQLNDLQSANLPTSGGLNGAGDGEFIVVDAFIPASLSAVRRFAGSKFLRLSFRLLNWIGVELVYYVDLHEPDPKPGLLLDNTETSDDH